MMRFNSQNDGSLFQPSRFVFQKSGPKFHAHEPNNPSGEDRAKVQAQGGSERVALNDRLITPDVNKLLMEFNEELQYKMVRDVGEFEDNEAGVTKYADFKLSEWFNGPTLGAAGRKVYFDRDMAARLLPKKDPKDKSEKPTYAASTNMPSSWIKIKTRAGDTYTFAVYFSRDGVPNSRIERR